MIAGIGNIFFGDDAFGCEVAQRLGRLDWPDGVQVRDFGIRGIDLAYALLEPWDHIILIDAIPRGGAPGALYVMEPDLAVAGALPPESQSLWDAHTMDPVKVLHLAQSMRATIDKVLIVGCEPSPLDSEDEMQSALSAWVEKAVGEAVEIVKSILEQLRTGGIADYQQLDLVLPAPARAVLPQVPMEETTT
ncbi:MAG TPA: hydrogenase maturation protease [Pirellulales bacterium]|nr:hydrogenase maturation protease [Pirellulales bacterium]